jgi:ketosteroid isomerase-like protein
MSQENVELIRRAHEALNRSELEWSEIHRIASQLLHPDVEWHDQRELPGATVHHGVEGVERHLAAAREALDYDPADLLELIDVDPLVVAVYRVHARGRSSGVRVERDACYVYSFRGPRIERVEIFGTKGEALEAVGRSEQSRGKQR